MALVLLCPLKNANIGDVYPIKICKDCRLTKSAEDFPKWRKSCKSCVAIYQAAYQRDNKNTIREQRAKYRELNREAISVAKAEYRQKNRDFRRARVINPDSREGYVYRLYDQERNLLYVGVTYNPNRRFYDDPSCHSETKAWWPEVKFIWVERYDTYAQAQEAERHIYKNEVPRHNQRPLHPKGAAPKPVESFEYTKRPQSK